MKKIIFVFISILILTFISCKSKSTQPDINKNIGGLNDDSEYKDDNKITNTVYPSVATIIVGTAEDLITLSQRAKNGETFENEYIWVQNNIDLNGHTFDGIKVKNNASNRNVFEGTFDGNSKKIININIEKTGENNIGFIAETSSKALIKDLTISGNITGGINIGGLVGINRGVITNSANDAGVVKGASGGGYHIGGIAGVNTGYIKSTYNLASVEGHNWVGGIVGFNHEADSIVENCYNIGVLKSTSYAGGIVGANGGSAGIENGGLIKNCYNIGTISATNKGSIVVHTRGGQYENNYSLANLGSLTGNVIIKTDSDFNVGSLNLDTSIWKDKTGFSIGLENRPVLINVGREGK